MMKFIKFSILIALVSALSVIEASGDTARDPYPFRAHLVQPFRSYHEVVDVGESSVSLDSLWSNTFVKSENLLVDVETFSADLTMTSQLERGHFLDFIVGWWWQGGGILDQTIDSWHELFGFPRGARDTEPDRQATIRGAKRDGSEFDISESGAGIDRTQIGYRYDLCTDHPSGRSCFISSDLRIPIGSDFVKSGADLSLGATFGQSYGKANFYLGGSLVALSDTQSKGIEYSRTILNSFIGGSYPLLHSLDASVELSFGDSGVENVANMPDSICYLDVGAIYKLGPNRKVALKIKENPFFDDSTTDFSMGLSFTSML